MSCPHCGSDVPPQGDRCPACSCPVAPGQPLVAAGVLTPPPASALSSDGTTIGGFLPSPTSGDDVTRLAASAPHSAADDVTRLSVAAPPRPGHPNTSEDTGPLAVGQAFSSRYHIIRVLGIGGMGAVYHAWDADLGVAVALKVIRPEATRDPAMAREMERRFKQELVLARQVTHKNVVRIHDLGEIDGIKYITMPYLEGEDLASQVRRAGKLDVPSALTVIRDVAAGLVAAHEAGIVHRDLKPANIMVLKDRAVIMDFGIARSAGASDQAAGAGAPPAFAHASAAAAATVVGTVLGTVQYMAPEQAKGQPVDQRADIYALGLIFRDIVLGHRTGSKPDASALDELQERLEKSPPPARTIDPMIPVPVEEFITRCLQPDPAASFQTSAEVAAALDLLDARGELIPVRRVVGMRLMAAIVVLLVGLAGGLWWYQRQFIPPAERDPVSIVIADFQNATGNASFDRTLEPMLRRALEGASFISAYDRDGIRRLLGVQPPERFDERAALEVAVKQGLGVVLSGSIEPEGRGYRIAVKATQAVTGNVIATDQGTASSAETIVEAATRLMTRVRNALGDDESESSQMFAMTSLSATSLDVVRLYAAALEASTNTNFVKARDSLLKAVELDPMFGIGYQSLAVVSRNLGRPQEAEQYMGEAIAHLDGMTERERFNVRGMQFRLTGNYESCVTEYTQLITRYAADVVGHNQRALCLTKLRRMSEAVDAMRRMTELLPNRTIFRTNWSWYASYAGDFQAAEQAARAIQEPDQFATHALAFSLLGQERRDEARATYESLTRFGEQGASMAAAGLADLAAYEGRYADAVRVLERGVAGDLKVNNRYSAALKLAALAHARLSQGNSRAAIAAADQALTHSSAVNVRFLAARAFVAAGNAARAGTEAASLASEPEAEPQAYARTLAANTAMSGGA